MTATSRLRHCTTSVLRVTERSPLAPIPILQKNSLLKPVNVKEEEFSKTERELTDQIEHQTESRRQCEMSLEQAISDFEKRGEELEVSRGLLKETRDELNSAILKLADAENRVDEKQGQIEEQLTRL